MLKHDFIAGLMGLRPGMSVLDWGAGCGHVTEMLALRYGVSVTVIDAVLGNVVWGRKHLSAVKSFCALGGSDLSDFADESFDAIISNSALIHIVDHRQQCKFIDEHILRILKPGGCVWFGWIYEHVTLHDRGYDWILWTNPGCLRGLSNLNCNVTTNSSYESHLFTCYAESHQGSDGGVLMHAFRERSKFGFSERGAKTISLLLCKDS